MAVKCVFCPQRHAVCLFCTDNLLFHSLSLALSLSLSLPFFLSLLLSLWRSISSASRDTPDSSLALMSDMTPLSISLSISLYFSLSGVYMCIYTLMSVYSTYNQLQIGWHRILTSFLKLCPRIRIRVSDYGVATIGRLLKNIGLFCRISSLLWGSFAKETYHFKEPTNRSHPIQSIKDTVPWYSNLTVHWGYINLIQSLIQGGVES